MSGESADRDAAGTLYVVSTPIGNLGDISFRAVETLRSVDAILAEDTRHSRHLLDRYEIDRPVLAYHEHNEARATPGFVARMVAGERMAIVTDAGTPLLSDPGSRLVSAAIKAGIAVVAIPGASALLSALVVGGLDASRFTFLGFLARSGRERREALDLLTTLAHTAVLYEAPGRVAATLAALEERGAGDRTAAVARELTKLHEEVRRGTVAELRAYYEESPPRGEVVILVGGATRVEATEEGVRELVRTYRAAGLSARDTATRVAAELGVPRRMAYQMAQDDPAAAGGEESE